MDLDLNASYDNGYFDKDEQGWCARQVEVRRDGDTVSVRTWGDDNGARAYDDTATYRVGEYLAELGVVRLLNEQGRLVSYFDVNRRGLRSVVEQEVARFGAPAGYMSRAAREALGAMLAPVARALQMAVGAPPPMPLAELTPSPTAEGTMEAIGAADVAGVAWRWMHRYYPRADSLAVGPHQMSVGIEGGGGPYPAGVSVFVQAPHHANFVMRGSIEVMPRALELRERAIAEWTGMVFPEGE
jgi:hypothetical protein